MYIRKVGTDMYHGAGLKKFCLDYTIVYAVVIQYVGQPYLWHPNTANRTLEVVFYTEKKKLNINEML